MFAGFMELTELPPLARFSIAMLILFVVPPLCRRVRLPAVVGLMAAGVLIGPFGLQLAPKHGEVVEFFSELGKLLLMFFAGMEIDLVQFNRTRNRSIGFGLLTFAMQVLELGIYVPAVLFGLGWLSQKLFALKPPKEAQFALMLLLVAIAAVAAEAIHLEGIIGAFLAGLAVNTATRNSEAKHELEFIGNHLFIPVFFLTIGFLIDLQTFATTLVTHFWLVFGIVGGLIGSKFVAAEIARRAFGYSRIEGLTMWSLSIPQVAATLAAALVAYNTMNAAGERLIGEPVLNAIIVLLVVTSVLGPILTERFAKQLPTPADE